MTRQSKVWGWTSQLHKSAYAETHIMTINSGFVCSKHIHKHKFNHLHVVNGKLKIHLFKKPEDGPYETYELGEGQSLVVNPGVIHQFECVETAVVVEIYWVNEIEVADIERYELGHEIPTSRGSV